MSEVCIQGLEIPSPGLNPKMRVVGVSYRSVLRLLRNDAVSAQTRGSVIPLAERRASGAASQTWLGCCSDIRTRALIRSFDARLLQGLASISHIGLGQVLR